MTTLCKFVDAIVASPGVRFDFNADPSSLMREGTVINPAPLNRAMGSNAMTAGGFVSASTYGMRTIVLHAMLRGSADMVAEALQDLMRELDRETNILMWHPQGAAKAVFFKTFRSTPDLFDMSEQAINVWRVRATILAEPFALGLRETIGPFTVNNDPAAGSNGHFFDVTGVIGDVPSPFVFVNTGTHNGNGTIAMRQHGTPSDMASWVFVQGESCTLGTDTTNPGGGPDAAMSGTGTNNYVRTSFATATMTTRITRTLILTDAAGLAWRGRYRLLAVVRRSDNTSVMTAQATVSSAIAVGTVGAVVAIPQTTNRQLVDLGIFTGGAPIKSVGFYGAAELPTLDLSASIAAARASGTGTLDWDYFMFIPADESYMTFDGLFNPTAEMVVDGNLESAYQTENGVDPFLATSSIVAWWFAVTGGFPALVPNQTNRVFYVIGAHTAGVGNVIAKADVGTVSLYYWPRYLFVRPSAT